MRIPHLWACKPFRFRAGNVKKYGCALFLLLALVRCTQTASASEATLRVDADVGPVLTINGDADTLWIGTALGLYTWKDAPRGTPQVVLKTPNVHVLLRDDKTLWIGSDEGLFHWDNPQQGGMPQLIPGSPQSIAKLHLFGTRLLISAAGGLFVLQDEHSGEPRPVKAVGPHVNSFCQDGDTKVWIGSDQGLFSWDGIGEPVRVPLDESLRITWLYKEGPVLLIGTSKGLLRWTEGPAGGRDWVFDDVEVYSLYRDSPTLLISTKGKGLRRLDDVRTGQWKLIAEDIGTSSRYYRSGDLLWMGAGFVAEAGLYRWNSRTDEPPQHMAGINTGSVHRFYRSGDTLWIGADKGLFKLDGLDTDWNAQLKIISKTPGIIYSDYSLPVRWRIDNYGWRTTPEQVYCRVILKDESENDLVVPGGEGYARHEVALPTLAPGAYTLSVEAADLHGKTSVSRPLKFQVHSSMKDVLLGIAKTIGLVYSLINIIAFIALVLLSRRYQWAFDLFTSPLVQKGGLYFGFALCHIRFVRLWVFERYYRELKREFDEQRPYLTAEINRPDGTKVEPDSLLGEFQKHPHILIQGEAGTGKTELLKRVLKIYCESPNLRKAFKLHGFIPIMVPLREFSAPGESGDDTTIPNLARLALGGKSMLFHDKGLFERLIRRKDFLVILDGLNETDIDKQVVRFVAASPKVRFLAASQTILSSAGIEVYQLPAMTPRFAKRLLAAFIGDERAVGVYAATTDEFWRNIKSGYDVRLIQNAVEAGRLVPRTRLQLFDATLRSAGEYYPLHTIYGRAWSLWKEKKRRFAADAELTDSLITPLKEAKVVVARGDKFEFRHDLMRGYLAACWAVREASSTEVIKGRLSEDGVWSLGTSEQDLTFPFLAELIETQDDLRQVAQFSADDPDTKMRLLIACKRAAESKGWAVMISLNEPSSDLLRAT